MSDIFDTAAEDYRVSATNTMLSPNATSFVLAVAIVDDSILENQEIFHLYANVLGTEQMFRTDVTINDNDCESYQRQVQSSINFSIFPFQLSLLGFNFQSSQWRRQMTPPPSTLE